MNHPSLRLCLAALGVLLLLLGLAPAAANAAGPIEAAVTSVENKWPDEVVFSAEARSSAAPVSSMTLRLLVGSSRAERYANVEITPGSEVRGSASVKTGGSRFIAAGADFTYWLEVADAAGNRFETPRQTFWYADTRFDWRSVSDGGVKVYYYGGAEPIARAVLQAAQETEQKSGRLLGVSGRPFTVMLYTSAGDIIPAQPPEASEAVRTQLIRAGIAYAGEGLVQVLSRRPDRAQDTARHEITHLFEHWAAGVGLPAWLNEGMAVWGQTDPGPSYRGALERAIRDDSLLLLRGLESFPGKPDQTILAYGQSYSIVNYLIDLDGGGRYRELYQAIKAGEGVQGALQRIYGMTIDELDARWRASVGAPPRTYESVMPTPVSLDITPIDAVLPDGTPFQPDSAPPLPPLLPAGVAAVAALILLGSAAAIGRRR